MAFAHIDGHNCEFASLLVEEAAADIEVIATTVPPFLAG